MRRIIVAVLGTLVLLGAGVVVAAPAAADYTSPYHQCGGALPPDVDRTGGNVGPGAAQIHNGARIGCPVIGAAQPGDRLDLYCYDFGPTGGRAWTAARNTRTGVVGWIRDDSFRSYFGSTKGCPRR